MIVQETFSNLLDHGKTSYFKMFSLGILVVTPNILAGMSECYSSIALPEMKLDRASASWFAAVSGYSGIIGILLIGFIIDTFGRKTTLLLGLIPHIIGWTLLYLDYSAFTAILGRSFTGLTAVAMFYPPQVYAVECITVNHEQLRNNFRAWPGIANSLGALLTFFSGAFLNYQQVSAMAALLAAFVFLIIFAFIPESPAWLHMKGRYGDAEISERKLGISQPVLQTLTDPNKMATGKMFRFTASNMREAAVQLARPEVYTPVIVMTVICALIMQTGGTVINAYMLEVIGVDESTSKGAAHGYSIVSGFLILTAHVCVSLVLPYLGCKKMSISMAFSMCLGMLLLGLTTDDPDAQWLHVLSVWIVCFSFHFGVLSVPVAVMSDLFPIDAKGFACIAILTLSLCGAFIVHTYPFLILYFGSGVYYGYAIGCLIYAAFVYYFMPETVGRTYEQVKHYLLISHYQ